MKTAILVWMKKGKSTMLVILNYLQVLCANASSMKNSKLLKYAVYLA